MNTFSHAMQHVGFFAIGSAQSLATAAYGIGTATMLATSSFFLLTAALHIRVTEPLLAFSLLSTSALGMATSDAAVNAGQHFDSAFSHC